jgi:hypothetical protein
VAAVSRTDLCQERYYRMTLKPNNIPSPAADQPGRLPPVRVKLRRPDAYVSQTYPLNGESINWWRRLKRTLGTTSSDFVNASLLQIQAAARSPFGTISETHINAALAIIEAAAPKNEIEAALAVQMACPHTAAMAVLAKMALGLSSESAAFVSAAARLMRAHATQVEVLRRLRHGNQRSTTEGGASCQRWVWFCRVVGR